MLETMLEIILEVVSYISKGIHDFYECLFILKELYFYYKKYVILVFVSEYSSLLGGDNGR